MKCCSCDKVICKRNLNVIVFCSHECFYEEARSAHYGMLTADALRVEDTPPLRLV